MPHFLSVCLVRSFVCLFVEKLDPLAPGPSLMPRCRKGKKYTRDPRHDKSEAFPGHIMAQVRTCDCDSIASVQRRSPFQEGCPLIYVHTQSPTIL